MAYGAVVGMNLVMMILPYFISSIPSFIKSIPILPSPIPESKLPATISHTPKNIVKNIPNQSFSISILISP